MQTILNLINGRLTAAASGRTLECRAPATGEVYASLPDSDAADVDAAVEAAKAAFPAWAGLAVSRRSRVLHALADEIDRNAEALAHAESVDTGKPITLARTVDIPRAAENLRFFADQARFVTGEFFETDAGGGAPGQTATGGALNYTLRRARGVAGLISPWNLPLYLLTWKIGPALATGNTAVCKPSEVTPMTAHLLATLAERAGLPAGVLNIVHGTGPKAGAALVAHPFVPTISFTGSTAVGRWIGQTAGGMLKRVSLELGGKNPFLIFEDADLQRAIATAGRAAFTNQGQICLCGSRLLVARPAFERVVEGVVQYARSLVQGDPLDPATQQGSLVSEEHRKKVASMVDEARACGATVRIGGQCTPPDSLPAPCRAGAFYEPTVLTDLNPTCRVEQEEIFGPVVSITPFDDDEEAIRLANSTAYGLAATLWTRDIGRALRIASCLEAGIIWCNCWLLRDLRTPFGGMKHSGVGREGGLEAIRFFAESRNVCVGLT